VHNSQDSKGPVGAGHIEGAMDISRGGFYPTHTHVHRYIYIVTGNYHIKLTYILV
jgi:hypothetical protein